MANHETKKIGRSRMIKRTLALTGGVLLAVAPTVAAWTSPDKNTARASDSTTPQAAVSADQSAVMADADTDQALPPTPTSQPAQDQVVVQGLAPDGTLKLTVGKSQLLVTAHRLHGADWGPAALTVGSADIVSAIPITPTSILVTAKKVGTTNLIVEDELGHRQAIEVTVDNDLTLLNVQLKQLSSDAAIEASDANGSVVLRGHVPNLRVADEAVQLATVYSARPPMNFLEIAGGQQVMLAVKFAEVNRQVSTGLGVNFSYADSASGGAIDTGQLASIGMTGGGGVADPGAIATAGGGTGALNVFGYGSVGKTAFNYFIEALRENQLLRVLDEPNLITESGEQASFLAGGQIPIPVPQPGASGTVITIQYQNYGVQLNFIPVVLGDGRIRIKVSPQVSALDKSNGIQLDGFSIPAFTTDNVQTVVELGEGQTFCLAGLLQNTMTATTSEIPGLSDLPVLGALFSSVSYQRDETELVVMVTPYLVSPMNPDQVTAMPGQHWRYPTESDLFLYRDLGGEVPSGGGATAPQANSGPAPRFEGQYGFVPTADTDVLLH